MTFFTVFALVLLPILGGFIAWAGDVIGYRMGKSRRSLLGMRPRVTARVIASFVGVILVLFTLAVAATGSREVRYALFSLDQLRNQSQALTAQNTRLHEENVSLQKQVIASDKNVGEARRQVQLAQKQGGLMKAQAEQAHGQLAHARGQLGAVQTSLGQARAQVATARALNVRLTAQATALRGQNVKVSAEYAVTKDKLQKASLGLVKVTGELHAVEAQSQDLQAQNQTLTAANQGLKQGNDQLASKNQSLAQDAVNLSRHIEALNHDIEARARELQQKTDELEQAQAQQAELTKTLYTAQLASDIGPVAYDLGQEIVSTVIDTRQSQDQVEASLQELLRLASAAAERHGAVVGESGMAAELVGPRPPEQIGTLSEQDIISYMARRIRLSDAQTYVVSVNAWRRVFEGETKIFEGKGRPVPVEFTGTPNTRLFRAGATINEATLNGSLTRGEIFRDLLNFIQQTRRMLADQGVRPDPNTRQILTIPAENILATLDDLIRAGAARKVQAVAGADVFKLMPESAEASVKLELVTNSQQTTGVDGKRLDSGHASIPTWGRRIREVATSIGLGSRTG